ncbi:hypothetical protein [Cryptosporangium sp. NPDC051539]|uniref:hypothetical protein n=1 Tax=Cryptosporangium sp. NPDC051539 TaxID=3363962 RepID=UPI003794D8C9
MATGTESSQTGPARTVRIGLWGAPQSGKTSFLAALQIAVVRPTDQSDWIIAGRDDTASDFLSQSTHQLDELRIFPSATSNSTVLGWRFFSRGPDVRTGFLRRRRPTQHVFEVETVDVAGRLFANVQPEPDDDGGYDLDFGADDDDQGLSAFDDPEIPEDDLERMYRHLAQCDALVYLFDPKGRTPYSYVQRTLEQLVRRADELGRITDGKLPHHLSVCITKLDDQDVFREAFRIGAVFTGTDEMMLPYVPPEYARELFEHLTPDQADDSGAIVRASIQRYFHPDRVQYFASSSVGFYVGPTGRFLLHDHSNVRVTPNGAPVIRSQVRPVSVLEPFLWLEKKVRAAGVGS